MIFLLYVLLPNNAILEYVETDTVFYLTQYQYIAKLRSINNVEL